jgi:hypothetical protein
MKKITLMIVAFGLAGAASAGVILGDVLAIDFGATATSTANYNIASDTSTTVADLVRLSDGALTGVSFGMTGVDQDNANNVASSVGLGNTTDADIYGDGILANVNATSTAITMTFTGLDDTLTYDLMGGLARVDTQNGPQKWVADWTADGQTVTSGTFAADAYVTLSGLSSTGGILSILVDGKDQYTPIAQLELTVVPEPATLGLVVAMGGGLLWIRRVFAV